MIVSDMQRRLWTPATQSAKQLFKNNVTNYKAKARKRLNKKLLLHTNSILYYEIPERSLLVHHVLAEQGAPALVEVRRVAVLVYLARQAQRHLHQQLRVVVEHV